MAAAYLFHLVKNHPFVDGNIRIGAVTALIFLYLNGFDFDAPEDDLAEMVLAVARGDFDKTDVAVFIRRHTRPEISRFKLRCLSVCFPTAPQL
jgi:death on curing protein